MGNADQRAKQVEGFPLFAAKALLASNRASAGSRVLEVIDSFINLFPFLSRKTSGTVSSHQTQRKVTWTLAQPDCWVLHVCATNVILVCSSLRSSALGTDGE
jgi:hypothetical protein